MLKSSALYSLDRLLQSTNQIKEILQDQPHEIINQDGQNFVILGTAHVSQTSVDKVNELLNTGEFDTVAVELDEMRFEAMTNPNRYKNMDLLSIIKNKQTGMVAVNLALSAYQNRLAKQLGVEPGAEMKAAINQSNEKELKLWKIDRNIRTTMKRAWRGMKFLEKAGLLFSFGGFFEKEEISAEEIEKLKKGDVLESTFSDFASESQPLYRSLIHERDEYMAARLLQESKDKDARNILVVIGAGHLQGMSQALRDKIDAEKTVAELDVIPPGGKWLKLLPWIITAVIVAGFAIGFSRSPELGWDLIKTWIIFNGVFAALGALVARAHIVTIISAFIAAPITSLNPAVAAGMVAALVETYFRKPKVVDFENLQNDATELKGWWTNPITRILLVFILTNLGSAIGTWVSGFKIAAALV
ncbi:MAG: TraB/GumN family protein [Xanthomonadales bacterium]|nr:TraB/GumN family protein [Xanthomonadales bacterium]